MCQKTNQLILKIFTLLLLICGKGQLSAQEEAWVKIHYLGHSAFVMEFDNGVKIVSDYGHYNAWVAWGWDSPIHDISGLVPDIMTYSHFHDDHYDPDRIPEGVPNILSEMDSLEYNGITILPIRTCETSVNIESNTSFLFLYKNLKILHLGDAQVQIISIRDLSVKLHMLQIIPDDLDMLLMTIEGQTKFIPQAEEFVRLFHPKCIIPIHHWSQAYLEDFLDYLETKNTTSEIYQIVTDDTSDYLLSSEDIVTPTKVIALNRSAYTVITGIEKKTIQLDDFRLYQNYPNPFNPTTSISYQLSANSHVDLSIYNVLGQKVAALVSEKQNLGMYTVEWHANGFSGGIYFYKIETDIGTTQTRKMIVLK